MASSDALFLSLGSIGMGEVLLILLLVLLLFGAHKIPELARSLGRAQREFQRARDEVAREARIEASDGEDQKVRRAARDLGIPVEGRSTAEIKAEIAQRMAPSAVAPA